MGFEPLLGISSQEGVKEHRHTGRSGLGNNTGKGGIILYVGIIRWGDW